MDNVETEADLLNLIARAKADRHRAFEGTGRGIDGPAFFEAGARLVVAERALARIRGEEYAEPIDIGVEWEAGAPLPLLMADDYRAVVLFHAVDRGESKEKPSPGSYWMFWGIIEFLGPIEVRIGGPNEEGLHHHPLHERGLRAFAANEVRNSRWLVGRRELEAKYRPHSAEEWKDMRHFFLAFHDSMIEALAWDIQGRPFTGRYQEALSEALKFLEAN